MVGGWVCVWLCQVERSSLTVLLVGCSIVVYCQRLIDEGDSWGRVAARGVRLDADVPVAAEGLQGLAVDGLPGCGGDKVVVLLSLGEGAAGAGEGGGEYCGGLHFGCKWLDVVMLVVMLGLTSVV